MPSGPGPAGHAMILGIDASNIRAGGGLTHLAELLHAADPGEAGFEKVVVWGSRATLSRLPSRAWIEHAHVGDLEGPLARRIYWQRRVLPRLAAQRCDILFVPGGACAKSPIPVVTMSQNLLPFEGRELLRFGLSRVTVRLAILRLTQARTFRRADGVIFLTRYAQARVEGEVGTIARAAVIPHGIGAKFFSSPKPQRGLEAYSFDRPLKFLYVSIVDMYKHQWRVVEAVARLRNEGLPVHLDLVGPSYPPALRKLMKTMRRFDPERRFVRYHGAVTYDGLPAYAAQADCVIFASTCENLPIILLEAMACGAPIACSDFGPMPEVLRDAGVYFNPEDQGSMTTALRELVRNRTRREWLARCGSEYAKGYSWTRCAKETFAFLSRVAREAPKTQ